MTSLMILFGTTSVWGESSPNPESMGTSDDLNSADVFVVDIIFTMTDIDR